jgi:hypothetical protein
VNFSGSAFWACGLQIVVATGQTDSFVGFDRFVAKGMVMRINPPQTFVSLFALMALAACGTSVPSTPVVAAKPSEVITAQSVITPLSWTAGPSLPAARAQAASVTLADGSVLLLGGSSVTAPTSVLKLAAGASAWTSLGTFDHIRVAPGAGLYGNNLIAVYGGADKKVDKTSTGYDPSTNRTSSLPSMSTARTQHAFASAFGMAYAIGGRDDLGNALASVETFGGGKWITQAALPEARVGAAAVTVGLDLLVFGGANATGTTSSTVYKFSGGAWTTLAPMLAAVQNAAVVAGKNNLIYVLGGSRAGAPVSTTQVYNTVSNKWSLEASLPVAISDASAAIDSTGRVMVIGGSDAANTNLSTVWTSPQSGAAPIVTSTAITTAVVGQPYSFQMTASGNPAPTFSLVSGPTGMAITASGLISWTPTAAQLGPQVVTIRASSADGQANQTFTIATQGSAPSVPTGLVASAITETSLTLSWNPSTAPLGTVSYEVTAVDCPAPSCFRGSPRTTTITRTVGTTANFSGLGAGTAHIYGVVALSSTGSRSDASASLTVNTLLPLAPTNVTVTTTQTTVGLSWTASVGPVPVTGYRIYDLINNFNQLLVDNITGTSATVTGLLPGTKHALMVVALDAALNESRGTAVDSVVAVTTRSVPSLVHIPPFNHPEQVVAINGQKLMVISAPFSLSTLVNKFDPATADYVVSAAGTPAPTLSVLSGPAGLSVDQLTGVVSYFPVSATPGPATAIIRATNSEGVSDLTLNFTVYAAGTDLLPPSRVAFLSPPLPLTNLTRTGVDVSWLASTDNVGVAGYDVYVQTPPPSSALPDGGLRVKVGTTTGTSLSVTGLTRGTTYMIYVRPFDAAGNMGSTGIFGVLFTTLP